MTIERRNLSGLALIASGLVLPAGGQQRTIPRDRID